MLWELPFFPGFFSLSLSLLLLLLLLLLACHTDVIISRHTLRKFIALEPFTKCRIKMARHTKSCLEDSSHPVRFTGKRRPAHEQVLSTETQIQKCQTKAIGVATQTKALDEQLSNLRYYSKHFPPPNSEREPLVLKGSTF